MQVVLSIEKNDLFSTTVGYYHELEGKETIRGERNMDLWNNKIGREVVQDMKRESGDSWKYMTEEMKKDIAAALSYIDHSCVAAELYKSNNVNVIKPPFFIYLYYCYLISVIFIFNSCELLFRQFLYNHLYK